MAMWMPLVLIGVHRTMVSGRIRDGVFTGIAVALQTLSSLYYGCYLVVYLVPVTLVLWIARGRPLAPLRALAAGALVGGMLTAPVAAPVRPQQVHARRAARLRRCGIQCDARAISSNRIRAAESTKHGADGKPERQLFPGFAPMVLSAVALWPPLNVVRLAYAAGLAIAVDGSLGFNGFSFRLAARLDSAVSRAPGARAVRHHRVDDAGDPGLAWRRHDVQTMAPLACAPRRGRAGDCRHRTDAAPPARTRLVGPPGHLRHAQQDVTGRPRGPSGRHERWGIHFDNAYIYFSTFHWQRLVNGNSGFFPPSYEEFTTACSATFRATGQSSTCDRAASSISRCTASS